MCLNVGALPRLRLYRIWTRVDDIVADVRVGILYFENDDFFDLKVFRHGIFVVKGIYFRFHFEQATFIIMFCFHILIK